LQTREFTKQKLHVKCVSLVKVLNYV